ncbi:MAG TPA: SEC-C metal-binding domain-containing protein [Bdellovibrionota bacterium]|nr:SEC-C metal-binding domain-containing protein [Bdellovibrionota bacterium]
MSDVVKEVGRNEPCPCGSGKKYKRCHGVTAAPKLSTPSAPPMAGNLPPELANMDPAAMMQLGQALQRLPRGQMQRLQSLMQRAMSGQDVSAEAEAFEKMLPPEFKQLVAGMIPAGEAQAESSEPPADMSPDDARRIIEEGVASGKLTREQADALLNPEGAEAAPLEVEAEGESSDDTTRKGGFWSKIRGK